MTDRQVNGARAEQTLLSWKDAKGMRVLDGNDLGEGLTMALLQAEALAVTGGARSFPTPVLSPEAPFQMRDLGAARSTIGRARADVQTVYLATHGAVRLAMMDAKHAWPWEVQSAAIGLPIIPVGYLIVAGVGLAASVLGATWWKTETDKEKIRVDGDTLRATAAASTVAALAQPYVVQGKPIPPELLEPLNALAHVERAASVVPWVGAALLAGGVVGAYLGTKGGGRG